jgi:hypothetical protein
VTSDDTTTGFCPKCGNPLTAAAEFCSKCGAPIASGKSSGQVDTRQGAVSPPKKAFYKKWWFWAVVIVVFVIILGRSGSSGTSSSGDTTSAQSQSTTVSSAKSPPTATAGPQIPDDQKTFVEIVVGAQSKARAADNDMQRGGIKADRDKALCAAVQQMPVKNWVGTLENISANSDGLGVLSVEIAKDVFVKTWNNALSDLIDKTLIQPGTPLFNTASQLKKGSRVKFSGVFYRATGVDCLKEGSLTLSGKLRSPEFIFRFETVNPE